jgi:pimeloyl-ACP methyl ester carboxylesterase
MRERDTVTEGYAPVNGLKLYYEVHGSAHPAAPPLVLLHGGGDTIQTSFGHLLPELSRHRQVIAFEQQGYGHTADIPDRPFTFEQSADDLIGLLDHLQVEQADLFGFSCGGTIALQAAIRHPPRVRKMVIASAFFRRDGGVPAFWDMIAQAGPKDVPQFLRDAYLAVAPQPENVDLFFRKGTQRMREFPDIPKTSLRRIMSPALILCGDLDIVRPEHAVETFRLIPNSRLAILPDTGHMALMSRTEWLVPMVHAFLFMDPPRRATMGA